MLPVLAILRGLVPVMVLAFLLPGVRVSAQDKTGSDSAVVFGHLSKVDHYLERSDPDSALLFAKLAKTRANSKNYRRGFLWSLVKTGDAFILGDNLDEAYSNADYLIQEAARSKDSSLIAIGQLQKAQVNLFKDKYDSAVYWFEKSLVGNHLRHNKDYLAVAYNDLGFTWGKKEDYEKMTNYCLKALTIYDELNKPAGSARALGNISTMYYEIGNKAKALDYGRRSLYYRQKTQDVNRLALSCCNFTQLLLGSDTGEVNRYAALCEKYSNESGDQDRIIHSLVTLSAVKKTQNQIREGLQYELKAIDILEKSRSDMIMLSVRYISAANYSSALKMDSSVTVDYFNKSIRIARELGLKKNLRDAYRSLSEYYKSQNDYDRALRSYISFTNYRDSVTTVERTANIADLEARYQTAKKDAEIAALNYDEKIRQLEIEKQKALAAGNKLLAEEKQAKIELIEKQKEINTAQLQTQEEELIQQKLVANNKEQEYLASLQQQKINSAKIEATRQLKTGGLIGLGLLVVLFSVLFLRSRLARKLAYQRKEQAMRNTIASDLHDDIGASISNINILNELTRRNINQPEKVKEYLSKTAEDIRQVSEGIGDIVWNINPVHDHMDQLLIRMKRYASDLMDAKNINYTIEFSNDLNDWKLDMDKRRDLYLIFKEAINNLAKYSKATAASVLMKIEQGYSILEIADNGVGFDAGQVRMGNGLQNMQQRAHSLGADFNFHSKPGLGTSLTLKIPMQQ